MVGKIRRRPCIYLSICRGKLLTSYRVLARMAYKDTVKVLKGCYGDEQLDHQ
jgi:hypothetical protein